MIHAEAFSASACSDQLGEQVFCLPKNVAAIQVLPAEGRDQPRLGMITQLPLGAELTICGIGFNDRTVKVRWAGGLYFVFLQDIEAPQAMTAWL